MHRKVHQDSPRRPRPRSCGVEPLERRLLLNGAATSTLSIMQQAAPTAVAAYPDTPVLSPTSIVEDGNTVSVEAANSFNVGDEVSIAGASPAGYDGRWVITSASSSQFTYSDTNTGLGAASTDGTCQDMTDPNLGVITINGYTNTGDSLTGDAGMYSLPGGPVLDGDNNDGGAGWSFDLRASSGGTRSVYDTYLLGDSATPGVYIFDAWFYIDSVSGGGNPAPLNDIIGLNPNTGDFYYDTANSPISVAYPVNQWFELREADVQTTDGSRTTVYTWAGFRLPGSAFDSSGWTTLVDTTYPGTQGFYNGTEAAVNGGIFAKSDSAGIFVGRYGMPTLMTSTQSWTSQAGIPSDVFAQVPDETDPINPPLKWYFSTVDGSTANNGMSPSSPLPMTVDLWNALSENGGFFYTNDLAASGAGDTAYIDAPQSDPLVIGENAWTIDTNGLNVQPWQNSMIYCQDWAALPNSGFTQTPGYGDVYQQTVAGQDFPQRNFVVWENGAWMNHLDLNNYDSLSDLLAALNSTPDSFYVDSTVTPCVVYINTADSSNPATDGDTFIRSICRSAENGDDSGNASAIQVNSDSVSLNYVSSTNTCMAEYDDGDSIGAYTFQFTSGGNTTGTGLYSWGSSKHGIGQTYSGNVPETTTFTDCDVEQGSPYYSQDPYVSYDGNGTYLTADFVQPAPNASVTISVESGGAFVEGDTITIDNANGTGVNYYAVDSVSGDTAVITNNGNPQNSPAGTTIAPAGTDIDVTVYGSVDSYIDCTTNASDGLIGSTAGLTYLEYEALADGASNIGTFYTHNNGGGPTYAAINIIDCHFDGEIAGGVAAQINITGTTYAGGSLSSNSVLSGDTIIGGMPSNQPLTGLQPSMTVTDCTVDYDANFSNSFVSPRAMSGNETWTDDLIDTTNADPVGTQYEPNGGLFDKTGSIPVYLSMTDVIFIVKPGYNWTLAEGFSTADTLSLKNNEYQLGPSDLLMNNYNNGTTIANVTLAQARAMGFDTGSSTIDFTAGSSPALSLSSGADFAFAGWPCVLDVTAGNATLNSDLSAILPNYGLQVESGAEVVLKSDQTLSSLQINGLGRVDVGTNSIIINYAAGNDPITSIDAYLTSGYNGGSWNGDGLFSTAAQTPTEGLDYSLGFADSADPGNPASLASNQIEVRYTLVGDVNLDGIVDGIDFSQLAAYMNTFTNNWDEGDFLYQGIVDGLDFSAFAANYGRTVTIPAAPTTADATSAFDSTSVDPESGDQPTDAVKSITSPILGTESNGAEERGRFHRSEL